MSFIKAVKSGQEHRKQPYRRANTCGVCNARRQCDYCEIGRMHKIMRDEYSSNEELMDYNYEI